MGDKSPKSKLKNKTQKQAKSDSDAKAKQSGIDLKRLQGIKPPAKGK